MSGEFPPQLEANQSWTELEKWDPSGAQQTEEQREPASIQHAQAGEHTVVSLGLLLPSDLIYNALV